MRLRTLPLALSCVFAGSAIVGPEEHFSWTVFVLTLCTTILLQVLSNLANDLGDAQNGADNESRIGPARAVQSGVISASSMRNAVVITGILALISGILLLWTALSDAPDRYAILWMLLLGLCAIAAAVRYTAGKNPYGYIGLGDVFVFVFFGWVGVCGTAFLQTGTLEMDYLLPATVIGLLSTAVLNLNNMRDIENDEHAGKRTIPVRLGARKAMHYHTFLITGAVLSAVATAFTMGMKGYTALVMMIIPLMHLLKARTFRAPALFDPELKKVALSAFLYSLLLFISSLIF